MKGYGESRKTQGYIFSIKRPMTSQWRHKVLQSLTLHEYLKILSFYSLYKPKISAKSAPVEWVKMIKNTIYFSM